jgi:hypothetical protein
MERAGTSDAFYMRPLRCCVSEGTIPEIPPCSECTISTRLPNEACECFSQARLESDITWLKRQDIIEGKNHDKVVSRLRS